MATRCKGDELRKQIEDGEKAAVELKRLQRVIFDALLSASKFIESVSQGITSDLVKEVDECRDGTRSWKSMGEYVGDYVDLADELASDDVKRRVSEGMQAIFDLHGLGG